MVVVLLLGVGVAGDDGSAGAVGGVLCCVGATDGPGVAGAVCGAVSRLVLVGVGLECVWLAVALGTTTLADGFGVFPVGWALPWEAYNTTPTTSATAQTASPMAAAARREWRRGGGSIRSG